MRPSALTVAALGAVTIACSAPSPRRPAAPGAAPPTAATPATTPRQESVANAAPVRWTERSKLSPSDGAAGEFFGGSLALDGPRALIGAERHAATAPFSGAAYVFELDAGTWVERHKLLPSDGKESDYFGTAVALRGDAALVGAPHHGDRPARSGAVYAFARGPGGWTEKQKLVPSDTKQDDAFGSAIGMGTMGALIASASNDERGVNSGAVYFFQRRGEAWVHGGKLVGSDTRERDTFGRSLALDGDTAVIGAIAHHDDRGLEIGAAYVFVHGAGGWTEQGKLVASDAQHGDLFGHSVAISGDTIVVGAIGRSDPEDRVGAAYVFQRTKGVWAPLQKLQFSDAKRRQQFGRTVAVAGDTVLVASHGGDDSRGAVTVFARRGAKFVEHQRLTGRDGAGYDFFGQALALSSSHALIGAHNHAARGQMSGAVYTFEPAL